MFETPRQAVTDVAPAATTATLGTLLSEAARRHPEKVAFRDSATAIGYGELAERTAAVAGGLLELGVRPGDTVAVFLPNGVSCVEAYIAAVRAGAVLLPIAAQSTPAEVEYCLRDAGARTLITDGDRLARIGGDLGGVDGLGSTIVQGTAEGAPVAHDRVAYETLARGRAGGGVDATSPDEPAWIMYTSGTTGNPKGVVLNQRGLLWTSTTCWCGVVGIGPDDQLLAPIPTHHSYGMGITVVATLASGGSAHVMRSFTTPDCLRILREQPITVLAGNPTIFAYLVRHAREFGSVESRLRVCVSSGATLPVRLIRESEAVFDVPLLDGYGATELSSMTTQVPPGVTPPEGSAGRTLPGISLRVVDPQSGENQPPGVQGELLVTGPQLMLGYHRRPDATAQAVRDGWYHTGDLATVDSDDWLRITGRLSEIIIRGGENIGPGEVEEVVAAHPSVLECAVVGVPDEMLGEVPVACVVLADDAGDDPAGALRTHCRARLARFKVPTRFVRVDEIPKTASGKVKRRLLRSAISNERETGNDHRAG